MLKEFKHFALKGNVLDLAIAVILGAAFGKVVTSLVDNVLMPPLGLLLGKVDFANLFLNLSGTPVASLTEAKKAGIPVISVRHVYQRHHQLPSDGTGCFFPRQTIQPFQKERSRHSQRLSAMLLFRSIGS